MCRLQNRVDLETEVHLTNLKTNVGGAFRVLWTNIREVSGFHTVGLEFLDADGDLWAMAFPTGESGEDALAPQVWLECQRCHQKQLTPVPEAQGEFLAEGFRVVRQCKQCKATTPWGFYAEPVSPSVAPGPETESTLPPGAGKAPAPKAKPKVDLRAKGRAPLAMPIKVTRKKFGVPQVDI